MSHEGRVKLFMEVFNDLSRNYKQEVNRQVFIDELVKTEMMIENDAWLTLHYAQRNEMIFELDQIGIPRTFLSSTDPVSPTKVCAAVPG